MSTHSCLYEGVVRHRRHSPVLHAFRYRLFLVYLDLAELDELLGRRGLWSTKPPAIAYFRRGDHLGNPQQLLDTAVRELVASRLGFALRGPIRLLTSLRYFGFVMNPLSLYYCFNDDGTHVDAVVAEVTNTPWNEQHCYVLDLRSANNELMQVREPKTFHVSPFLEMAFDYHWTLSTPGERLTVRIENVSADGKPFDASLELRQKPLTRWSMAWVMFRYPWMTLQVFLAIYWQALRLWWKRVPYVPHPGPAHQTALATSTVTIPDAEKVCS